VSGQGPETREADSWFTGEQLSQLARADDDAALAVPTHMAGCAPAEPNPW
jgi:hypothetical protein